MYDARDLSGVWYGGYWGGGIDASRFIALFTEAGGGITGTISEPDTLEGGPPLTACVRGVRSGRAVRFIKQYDGAGAAAHAVAYDGVVDASGTRIAGLWAFAAYSGGFEMTRERFDAEWTADEAGTLVPAGG